MITSASKFLVKSLPKNAIPINSQSMNAKRVNGNANRPFWYFLLSLKWKVPWTLFTTSFPSKQTFQGSFGSFPLGRFFCNSISIFILFWGGVPVSEWCLGVDLNDNGYFMVSSTVWPIYEEWGSFQVLENLDYFIKLIFMIKYT